jgi:hypothetical protein
VKLLLTNPGAVSHFISLQLHLHLSALTDKLHSGACIFHYVAILDQTEETWIEASGIVDPNSIVDRYVTSM